ncbi:MAG: hypothetical protein NW220_07155 [Leptolyngbyaceae cyanobacterium bins.349]|nr:hypothetical protein [Leptolyngbyaceae cyanobacterium bins.349]
MSAEKKRKVTWWLPITILGILAAAGIRYLSSTEWWGNVFNQERQTFQTVNTGVSVQVSTATTPQAPLNPPSQPEPLPTTPSQPPRRMW